MGRSPARHNLRRYRSTRGSNPLFRKSDKAQPARALRRHYVWRFRRQPPLRRRHGPGNKFSKTGANRKSLDVVDSPRTRGRARLQRRCRRGARRDRRGAETQTRGELDSKMAGNRAGDGAWRSAISGIDGQDRIPRLALCWFPRRIILTRLSVDFEAGGTGGCGTRSGRNAALKRSASKLQALTWYQARLNGFLTTSFSCWFGLTPIRGELTPARPLRHQPSDALAADAHSLGRQLGMDARRTVGAARGRMRRTDFADQRRIRLCTPRPPPLHPRIVATGGDTQQPTHAGNRIVRLVIAHELEPFCGIVFVSRANQAAAFDRISRSSLSWRFSRRNRLSSSRSAVVRPPSPRPASRSHCATQFLIDCAVGSNSRASSSGERPARTRSAIWRRNSGGYAALVLPIVDSSNQK